MSTAKLFHPLPADKAPTKQAPAENSWWITPTGRLDPQEFHRAQQRMNATITTAYRTANGE
jgi:hypothetical protein